MATSVQPHDFDLANAEPIGCGALALVYKAKHRKSQKTFAIKIISKIQAFQQQKVASIFAEKQALYDLGPHPLIVKLIHTMQSDDELYFVLEHLPHGDLLEHIRFHTTAGKRLPFADIQLITAQLILALQRVFEKGYVLRDLKPENVAFDQLFRSVLIDFDTAIKCSDLPETNHGQPIPPEKVRVEPPSTEEIQAMRRKVSFFCGTAQYVSPEMIGECKWSYSSDLWALGTIVYQMLMGKPLFDGASSFEIMKDLVKGINEEAAFPPDLFVVGSPGTELEFAL